MTQILVMQHFRDTILFSETDGGMVIHVPASDC
jgi:hypothetical protein